MLTLTRKIGESLCIGDDIKIVVKEIRGKQVRLGIQAPPDVYVCREELYEKIQAANKAAAGGPTDLNALGGLLKSVPGAARAMKARKAPPASGGAPEAAEKEQKDAG